MADICSRCAEKASEQSNINGACQSIGGINPVAYFADVSDGGPESIVKNADGSLFDFDLPNCKTWKKIEMRKDVANITTTKTDSPNGLIYQQTANLFVNDLGDQATKDAVFALENADKVLVAYQTNNGTVEIAGFNVGLRGTGGQRLTGANRTEVNRNEIVLTANEKAEPITLDRGSLEDTLEWLESKTKGGYKIDPVYTFKDSAGDAIAGDVVFLQAFERKVYAVVDDGGTFTPYESLDKGNSWTAGTEFTASPANGANGRKMIAMLEPLNFNFVDSSGDVYQLTGPTIDALVESTAYDNSVGPGDTIECVFSENGKVVVGGTISALPNQAFVITSSDGASFTKGAGVYNEGVTIEWSVLSGVVNSDQSILLALGETSINFDHRIIRTIDDGDTFELVSTQTATINNSQMSRVSDKLLFLSSEIPADNFLYRSEDGGKTWAQVLTTATALDADFGKVVNTDFGLFVDKGDLYISEDCGATWTLVDENTSTANSYITQSEGDTVLVGGDEGLNAIISKFYLPCVTAKCN